MPLKPFKPESESSRDTKISLRQKSSNEEVDKSEVQLSAKEQKIKSLNILLILLMIAGLVGGGYGIYRLFFYKSKPNTIFLSGRIEGYETDISAKIGGKIAQVSVREGDTIKLNQVLVKIDDADLSAQLKTAQARVSSAQRRLELASQQIPILQAQLEEANLMTEQAAQESEGRVIEAQNSLASIQAKLKEAEANLNLALAEQRRSRELFAQGAISEQQKDQDDARAEVANAELKEAKQEVESARGLLIQAQARLRDAPISAAKVLQIKEEIAKTKIDIEVSQHEIEEATAQQEEIEARLNYLTIKSPKEGSVITRFVEPGEVIGSGVPLLTLVNLNNLYLRGFIPTAQIGQVKVGQKALVHLDSSPNQPLEAIVTRIDPKASFTPENVYFKEDRITQVFGVQLTLKDHQGLAKPGVPAEGEIILKQRQ